MTIPNSFEICKPLLELFSDGEAHDFELKYLEEKISDVLKVDLESLSNSEKNSFRQNIKASRTLLKKYGLLYSPSFPMYAINNEGINFLQTAPDVLDEDYFKNMMNNNEFIETDFNDDDSGINIEVDAIDVDATDDIIENVDVPISNENEEEVFENYETSQETQIVPKEISGSSVVAAFDNLDRTVEMLNDDLADKILVSLANLTQESFEQLVIDLLSKMGYRAFRSARYTHEASGDNLIHGVILEDKAGLAPIYIQAKKSNPDKVIGRAELQNFSRVLSERGGKGLFATTASFSEEAEIYSEDEHLMLIDGNKLSHLMIAKEFCVSVEKVIEVKSLDKESFSEYIR